MPNEDRVFPYLRKCSGKYPKIRYPVFRKTRPDSGEQQMDNVLRSPNRQRATSRHRESAPPEFPDNFSNPPRRQAVETGILGAVSDVELDSERSEESNNREERAISSPLPPLDGQRRRSHVDFGSSQNSARNPGSPRVKSSADSGCPEEDLHPADSESLDGRAGSSTSLDATPLPICVDPVEQQQADYSNQRTPLHSNQGPVPTPRLSKGGSRPGSANSSDGMHTLSPSEGETSSYSSSIKATNREIREQLGRQTQIGQHLRQLRQNPTDRVLAGLEQQGESSRRRSTVDERRPATASGVPPSQRPTVIQEEDGSLSPSVISTIHSHRSPPPRQSPPPREEGDDRRARDFLLGSYASLAGVTERQQRPDAAPASQATRRLPDRVPAPSARPVQTGATQTSDHDLSVLSCTPSLPPPPPPTGRYPAETGSLRRPHGGYHQRQQPEEEADSDGSVFSTPSLPRQEEERERGGRQERQRQADRESLRRRPQGYSQRHQTEGAEEAEGYGSVFSTPEEERGGRQEMQQAQRTRRATVPQATSGGIAAQARTRYLEKQLVNTIGHVDVAEAALKKMASKLREAFEVRLASEISKLEDELAKKQQEMDKAKLSSNLLREREDALAAREKTLEERLGQSKKNEANLATRKSQTEQVETLTKQLEEKTKKYAELQAQSRIRETKNSRELAAKDATIEELNQKLKRTTTVLESHQKNKALGRSVSAHRALRNEVEEAAARAPRRNGLIRQRVNNNQENEPPATTNGGKMVRFADSLENRTRSRSPSMRPRRLSSGVGEFGQTIHYMDPDNNRVAVTTPACGCLYFEYATGDSRWLNESGNIMVEYFKQVVETGKEPCVAVTYTTQPAVCVRYFMRTGQLEIFRRGNQRSVLKPNGERIEVIRKLDDSRFVEIFPPSSDRVVVLHSGGEKTMTVSPGEHVCKRLNGSYVTMNTGDVQVEWVEDPFVVRYRRDRAVAVAIRDVAQTEILVLPSDSWRITHAAAAAGASRGRVACVEGGYGSLVPVPPQLR